MRLLVIMSSSLIIVSGDYWQFLNIVDMVSVMIGNNIVQYVVCFGLIWLMRVRYVVKLIIEFGMVRYMSVLRQCGFMFGVNGILVSMLLMVRIVVLISIVQLLVVSGCSFIDCIWFDSRLFVEKYIVLVNVIVSFVQVVWLLRWLVICCQNRYVMLVRLSSVLVIVDGCSGWFMNSCLLIEFSSGVVEKIIVMSLFGMICFVQQKYRKFRQNSVKFCVMRKCYVLCGGCVGWCIMCSSVNSMVVVSQKCYVIDMGGGIELSCYLIVIQVVFQISMVMK